MWSISHFQQGGGEYPTQDGFGWTNGVTLALWWSLENPSNSDTQ